MILKVANLVINIANLLLNKIIKYAKKRPLL